MDQTTSRKRVKGEIVPFGKLMAALTTLKRRDRLGPFDVQVYEEATAHIDLAILSRAVSRLLTTTEWFPTVHELLEACEAIRVELRGDLKFEPCAECAESPGFRPVGQLAVERCPCWHIHQARVKQLGLPEEPLALPAAKDFTQIGDDE